MVDRSDDGAPSTTTRVTATPGPDVFVRAATRADEPFLRELFHDVRGELFARLELGPGLVEALLDGQWDAQRRSWGEVFPGAHDRVVELAGRPVGRLLLDEHGDDLHVVDLALLAEVRGRGVGTHVLGNVLAAGEAEGRAVTLSVARDNVRAVAWYRRAGFVEAGATDTHVALRREPTR